MKVLERGKTPDGTRLVRVDWSEDYPSVYAYGECINAYPIAKESAEGDFAPECGRLFLLELNCGTEQNAKQVFEQLKIGTLSLKDCEEYAVNKKHIKLI